MKRITGIVLETLLQYIFIAFLITVLGYGFFVLAQVNIYLAITISFLALVTVDSLQKILKRGSK